MTAKHDMSVERIYQKKSPLEHILLRPDTYVGSVEKNPFKTWVYDKEADRMINKEVFYAPALYKIFDEILVNAADNKQRDASMNCIKIEIKPEQNKIRIWNNGAGIPVAFHKDEKMYVPTMIFGHLLTSSNYDDTEKKVTGGRNGYGAKLCNIFSKKFIVETSSSKTKKSFKQVWMDNMTKTDEPDIEKCEENDFTSITFYPDLARFGMEELEKDICDVFSKRAYDIAASCPGIKVFLNGRKLPISGFRDYVNMFIKEDSEDEDGEKYVIHYEKVNPRWEVAITSSVIGFQQVSFVNSIATTKGGTHVDYVADSVANKLVEVAKKKLGKTNVSLKKHQILNHMWVFINCLIENPTFDSQTKENMTLPQKSFGSKCELSEKYMTALGKSGIIEHVMSWAKFKSMEKLDSQCSKSKKSKIKGIPKLDDANDAGGKNSHLCTLILTEGDSAKSLAVAGLGVVGRDYYGVFPLRGKMLNVREASVKQVSANAEVCALLKILGLQYKNKYETAESLKSLRYGKIMIMTDQDQDGSHIKGLLINFIHCFWPNLLKKNFLEEFITPIVKVFKGKEEKSFYSLPEFEDWQKNTPNWHTWRTKYYKGLGTSSSKEAKEYFNDMERHKIDFTYTGPQDDKSVVLAFGKSSDDRKEWLSNWMTEKKRRMELDLPEVTLYGSNTKAISYHDFVHQELVLFSNMDNERSIPSMVDGLKPGQRKVLFTCIKRNLVKELKVAQLAGSVAEMSAYHHGEASLMSTIIGMAQDFVGSNNVNLLFPSGQFGTRLAGGKDAASSRYIHTRLMEITRLIFHPDDDAILKYLKDDNKRIEPEYYVPIIPLVLINGAEGIGTGWSTRVLNFDLLDIIEAIRGLIHQKEPKEFRPSYRGFRGEFHKIEENRYVCFGEVSIIDDTTVEITELPIKVWTQNYKENVLEPMLNGSEKIKTTLIEDYKEYHTDQTVKFVIKMSAQGLRDAERIGLHKFFKLSGTHTTNTMVLFDSLGCIKKYNTIHEILLDFYELRVSFYLKRKKYLDGKLTAEMTKLDNQARFIVEKIEGIMKVENKPKKVIIEMLAEAGYDSDPVQAWKETVNKIDALEDRLEELEARGEAPPEAEEKYDFNYILNMPIWNLSYEKKEEMLAQQQKKRHELELIRSKTAENLYEEDLDALELAYKKSLELEEKELAEIHEKMSKKLKGSAGAGRGKKRNAGVHQDTLPNPNAVRVVPVVDKETFEKVAAKRMKDIKKETKKQVDKLNGETGDAAISMIKEEQEDDEDDEFKMPSTQPLAKRLSLNPETSLTTSKTSVVGRGRGRGKRNTIDVPKPSAPKKSKASAVVKGNKKIDDMFSADSGDAVTKAPKKKSSDKSDDSFNFSIDNDSDNEDIQPKRKLAPLVAEEEKKKAAAPAKKTAPKKKPAPAKKAKVVSQSDESFNISDEEDEIVSKSSAIGDDSDEDRIGPSRSRRATNKNKVYAFDSEDDE